MPFARGPRPTVAVIVVAVFAAGLLVAPSRVAEGSPTVRDGSVVSADGTRIAYTLYRPQPGDG